MKHSWSAGSDTKGKPIKFIFENLKTNTWCVGGTMINEPEEVFSDDKQRAWLASFKAVSLSPNEAKNIISCLRYEINQRE